jgi:hypothetical protein
MTEAPEDDALWLPPLSLVIIVFIIWLISFTPGWLAPNPLVPFNVTGQALLLFIVLRAFCCWPPMVHWVTSMPAFHRAVFLLLIGGMIVGHYTLDSRRFYPYVSWFIFPTVREDDPVTCREFIATTSGGKKVRLIAEQLFPSIVQIYPLDDPQHFSDMQLDDLAHALAAEYNRLHPDDPVHRVDLVVMAVKLHPPASESRAEPSCQLLKRYEVSSAR